MIYKLFLQLNDGKLDYETDYCNVSRYDAFADFATNTTAHQMTYFVEN